MTNARNDTLNDEDISRVIEMAWQDNTPFEAIERQFFLNESEVIALMRSALKASSFRLWRKRMRGRANKHENKKHAQQSSISSGETSSHQMDKQQRDECPWSELQISTASLR